jgi:V8-like Glu-specific endopeptidase
MPFTVSALLVTILLIGPWKPLYAQVEVIYGADNRFEVHDYDNELFIKKAKSVALRVSNRKLSVDRENPTLFNFPHITLQQANPSLCHSERFLDQVQLGTCSGFLIAPNKIMTAGHCMMSQEDCDNHKWVFDYKEGTEQISKKNIFSCQKIVIQKFNYSTSEIVDYAVIELDRPVQNRKPLETRKFGLPFYNTPLVLIGHPLGLPMKIADGARVTLPNAHEREDLFHSILMRKNYFTANLDAFAGNSGSPVFNQNTGKVEGIMIQGSDDYKTNSTEGCIGSIHRGNSAKEAIEKVMRITQAKF